MILKNQLMQFMHKITEVRVNIYIMLGGSHCRVHNSTGDNFI